MFDFKVKLDFEVFNKIRDLKVSAGIIRGHNKQIKASTKGLRTLRGTPLKANRMSGKLWGKGLTTEASSFASVWKHTNLDKYFAAVWKKRGSQVIEAILQLKDSTTKKRLENSMAALLSQAYANMAWARRSSPRRAAIKGHWSYAIGTGQTFNAIRGEVEGFNA